MISTKKMLNLQGFKLFHTLINVVNLDFKIY